MLKFVRVSLQSHKVNLLSLDRDVHGPGEENLPLLVDNTLREFTISVSGKKPKIQVCLLLLMVVWTVGKFVLTFFMAGYNNCTIFYHMLQETY